MQKVKNTLSTYGTVGLLAYLTGDVEEISQFVH